MTNSLLNEAFRKAEAELASAPRFKLRRTEREPKESAQAFEMRRRETMLEDLASIKQEVGKCVEAIQNAIDAATYEANDAGVSWGKIAKALRKHPQAVHRRYASGAQERNLEDFRRAIAQDLADREKPGV